ncbi:NAD-dependent epimerase/dehydratase family protein [Mesorhizobium sp.]|uniref:NAD-dependent epimerase/dehydratase family protein n=1 Tax=Mesorhizobium sp. TaxID=1871066 RepID=UPI00342D0338
MTSIAILGANGRLGRVVAKAFIDAGYEVRAVTRNGKLPTELEGATAVAGDALDREALIRATEGVDIIFNGLNPIYTEWVKCLPIAENVMAACRANNALHLFPGTVYNYGSPMPEVITEDTPFRPTTEKGRIRVAMEDLFHREAEARRVRTIILRAGDFFGGTWSSLPRSTRVSIRRPARSTSCMNGPTCRIWPGLSSDWRRTWTSSAPMKPSTSRAIPSPTWRSRRPRRRRLAVRSR